MDDCVFCGIVGKKVPATIVFENDEVLAFPDVSPKAPVHVLVVPKAHVGSIDSWKPDHAELLGRVIMAAGAVGNQVTDGNFSLQINAGNRVEVDHFHVHILGNRKGGDDA